MMIMLNLSCEFAISTNQNGKAIHILNQIKNIFKINILCIENLRDLK